jgi:hypothetical protein
MRTILVSEMQSALGLGFVPKGIFVVGPRREVEISGEAEDGTEALCTVTDLAFHSALGISPHGGWHWAGDRIVLH